MRSKRFTEHLELVEDDDGVFLRIDDETLFDFVEDWLEHHWNIVHDYSFEGEGVDTMAFKPPVGFEQLDEALSALDPTLVERVFTGDESAWEVDLEE